MEKLDSAGESWRGAFIADVWSLADLRLLRRAFNKAHLHVFNLVS